MSRTLKKFLLVLLSSLFLVCCGIFATTNNVVFAESGNLAQVRWVAPYVDYSGTEVGNVYLDKTSLVFPVSIDNAKMDGYNGSSLPLDRDSQRYWTEQRLRFTINYLETNTQGGTNEIAVAYYDIVSYGKYTYIFYKKLSNKSNVTANFMTPYVESKLQETNTSFSTEYIFDTVYDDVDVFSSDVRNSQCIGKYVSSVNKFGFPLESKTYSVGNSSFTGAFIFVQLQNLSFDEFYSVTLDYEFYNGATGRVIHFYDDNFYGSNIKSTGCQVIENLHDLEENNFLTETYFSDVYLDFANVVLDNYSYQDIQVKYLVRILDENGEGSPFATSTTSTVHVPVWTTSTNIIEDNLDDVVRYVNLEDVLISLNLSSMILNNSTIDSFGYDDETDTWIAHYRDSIYLSGKTVDGNSLDYFLDINKSYYEYFYPFVQDGIFTEELYSYLYNSIILRYPYLETVNEEDLYGYFGFVVIPSTFSINALWKNMFNESTTFSGSIQYFVKENQKLSLSDYSSLLDDYNYSWLANAWNSSLGLLSGETNASYYVFYVDSFAEGRIFIGENSATDVDDNDGTFERDAEGFLSDLVDSGSSVFKVVFLVLLVIFIIWALSKVFGLFSSISSNRKRRKK